MTKDAWGGAIELQILSGTFERVFIYPVIFIYEVNICGLDISKYLLFNFLLS